jgi:hypothetical protein
VGVSLKRNLAPDSACIASIEVFIEYQTVNYGSRNSIFQLKDCVFFEFSVATPEPNNDEQSTDASARFLSSSLPPRKSSVTNLTSTGAMNSAPFSGSGEFKYDRDVIITDFDDLY